LVFMYNKQYNLNELSVKLLLVITGLRVVYMKSYSATGYGITTEIFQFRHGHRIFIVDIKDIVYAAGKLSYLFKTEDINGQKVYTLNSQLSKNLLPKIQFGVLKKKLWYGPTDNLTNLIFCEWIHSENEFARFIKSGNENYLNRLVAVLYREKSFTNEYNGDVRKKFNDFLIDKNAGIAKRIPLSKRIAILLFYSGCRQALIKIFPDVFSGSSSGNTHAGDAFRSYLNLVETLAGFDVTKKEDVRNNLLYDVLYTINQSIIRDKELETKLNKKPRV